MVRTGSPLTVSRFIPYSRLQSRVRRGLAPLTFLRALHTPASRLRVATPKEGLTNHTAAYISCGRLSRDGRIRTQGKRKFCGTRNNCMPNSDTGWKSLDDM